MEHGEKMYDALGVSGVHHTQASVRLLLALHLRVWHLHWTTLGKWQVVVIAEVSGFPHETGSVFIDVTTLIMNFQQSGFCLFLLLTGSVQTAAKYSKIFLMQEL